MCAFWRREKNPLSLPAMKLQFFSYPARRLTTLLTALFEYIDQLGQKKPKDKMDDIHVTLHEKRQLYLSEDIVSTFGELFEETHD